MASPSQSVDPITLELVKNALTAASDRMALTVVRTAYSAGIKAAMDFSTALCDSKGQMLAQGLCLPLHLGSVPTAMEVVLDKFGDLAPDDVVILNDPFAGGMHLPDFFVIRPVFINSQLVGFAVSIAHHQDVGGRVPGSGAADSSDFFQEGIRIPPLKLYERGEPNATLLAIVGANVRLPDKLMGDLRAQLSACHVGQEVFYELADRYGPNALPMYFRALLDATERRTREEIASLPDGTYRFTDHIDSTGITEDALPISVSIDIRGDEISVDFTGSASQVQAALNATLSSTKSAVYLSVKTVLGADLPNNAGYFRPIHVTAPSGSIVNASMPAATGARGLTVFRIVDAMLGALAEAVPDRVMAASEGGNTTIRIGGYHDGNAFLYSDIVVGSWGGRAGKDGIEGAANLATNLSNEPVELVELEHPVLIERYGIVPDTGGAGEFRGGLSLIRDIRFLGDEGTLQLRSDRRRFVPYGLFGGRSGTPSSTVLNPDTENSEVLNAKVVRAIRKGDLLRHITAGAGGYGDPLERDVHRVRADLRAEKVSRGYALREYAVVTTEDGELDIEATAAERRRRALSNVASDGTART